MIQEYKLSNIQLKKYIFLPLIKLVAVIVIATVLAVVWFDIRIERLHFVVGFTWAWAFLMHLLPLLIMGCRHCQLSRDSSFAIDTINNFYYYHAKDKSLTFRLGEIDKVIKVVSPPKYDKRMDFMGFSYFFYWKIKLLSGKTLSISCMLLDIDEFLGKDAILEKRLFPIPPSNQDLMEFGQNQ